ncbi:M42 family metallopeptidase [Haloplasma contractile]|uniref:Cellulase M protein n=1 Tax=Haloplasma contractile SSD-17B TaxID=1033810 RepID=U2FLJ9_9MOLU|nr:M42 family metallopeptidase [Haloplasma contractile]ERJ13620.1 Cellulase M protein [Haloplasma contractile SSD-17B]
MKQETMQLLKNLSELHGAPGFEHQVRAFMRKELDKYSDELIQDKLGSIYGVKKGDEKGPRVMVAGHMDEVGFMVTKITDNGMIKFQTLGGWWNQVMLAQRVLVHTNNGPIMGVIGSVPPHLLSPEARKKPMEITKMLIDIGADSKEHAKELGIRPGQQITPYSQFAPTADNKKLLGKAWDNRYGCALSIELLKELQDEQLPNTLFSGANVQEEVGLRGAQTAANMIKPDVFFALDASPANDMSGDKTEFGQLGKGVLLRIFDRTMITHRGIREYMLDMCETHDVPYQYFTSAGGTDAGKVHISNEGVPSILVGIPSRYIHSHTSMMHVDDYAAAKEILVKMVKDMDQSTLDSIKANV